MEKPGQCSNSSSFTQKGVGAPAANKKTPFLEPPLALPTYGYERPYGKALTQYAVSTQYEYGSRPPVVPAGRQPHL